MVALSLADEAIESLLTDDPWSTYPPRFSSFLSKEPIVTIKSQPLLNFGVKEDGSDIHVKIADFGHGKHCYLGMGKPRSLILTAEISNMEGETLP